mgnify:FL=1
MAQQPKVVKVGPGGRSNGPRPKVENPGKVFKRILAYVMSRYKAQVIVVLCCILLAVFAQLQGVMFSQTLIDSYILPLLKAGSTDFSGLAAAILRVAGIYCAGIAAVFVQNRLMARITQGTLKDLRDEMFTHMQTLPIKYFDTHAHGDIMSVYTNDIDTLRQMISQSLPQLVNTVVTLVGVLASMLYLSVPLTVLALAMVGVMLLATKYLTGNSGKYFIKQQQELGKVNGYIEEMMNGQKVIKVFCHEEIAIEEFDRLNDELFHSADKANSYSLVAMPVNGQLGNLSYVFCAILGGALAINGFGGFTLGGLASFLVLTRQFNQPISQISMQLNSVVMALAGGARIFALLDEKPEVNEGDITLVHAKYEADDTVTEANESTGMWAWKRMDATASPGTPSWRATSSLRMWTSATTRRRSSCMTSTCMAVRGRRSPLSAPPARARRRSRTLSTASTTSRRAGSCTTATTSSPLRRTRCAPLWASSCRIPTCSPARSWRTSVMAA